MRCRIQAEEYRTIDESQIQCSYCVDWVQGVCFSNDVGAFFEKLSKIDSRLSFNNFQQFSKGLYSYHRRYGLNNSSIMTVCYNPCSEFDFDGEYCPEACNPDLYAYDLSYSKGFFVSITGDGLRFLGEETAQQVLFLLKDFAFRCSRIDFACDLYDKDNWVIPLLRNAFMHCMNPDKDHPTICSRMARTGLKMYIEFDHWRDWVDQSLNVQFGNGGSTAGMFRMYDKYIEIKSGRLAKISDQILEKLPSDYWYRMEYAMHNQYANSLFYSLINAEYTVGQCFGLAAKQIFMVANDGEVDKKFSNVVDMVKSTRYLAFLNLSLEDHIIIKEKEKTRKKACKKH